VDPAEIVEAHELAVDQCDRAMRIGVEVHAFKVVGAGRLCRTAVGYDTPPSAMRRRPCG
jgi:hypothetical protein